MGDGWGSKVAFRVAEHFRIVFGIGSLWAAGSLLVVVVGVHI